MKDKVCQFPEVSISKIVRQNLFLSVFKITKEFLKAFLASQPYLSVFHFIIQNEYTTKVERKYEWSLPQ